MRLNEDVSIITNKLVFVPYEASHVETYSRWMASETLREATASERLSLPEEYAMQASWREDADKLTFVLCMPSLGLQRAFNKPAVTNPEDYIIIEGIDDASDLLIGDVNLFLYEDDGDLEEGEEPTGMVGEIEVMVARAEHQGRKLGKIAVLVFMLYVMRHKEQMLAQDATRFSKASGKTLKYLRVKIGQDNARSLVLFQSLGFKKCTEEPNIFGEFELRLTVWPQEAVELELKTMLASCGVDCMKEVEFRKANSVEGAY
ncbi:hypothetical protein DRE_04467 [Drechslerella stenobrocha 248]|uniref:N-acetyltransferase domain-containing protein n=1 Tax=Drechslerella stenobrocha 248 TaxID=1043628 RepID=W7HQ57_9PEZI|nr:hypothetical protein DRE_04467 [Drechslerella stenobrocha 248]